MHIIEVIEMQNNSDEWNQKYDALVQGKIDSLRAMSPEAREVLRRQWADLFRDIGSALDQDPASAESQKLAERWLTLLSAFAPEGARRDPQLLKTFAAADQPSRRWPAGAGQPQGAFADPRIWDFIQKALSAR